MPLMAENHKPLVQAQAIDQLMQSLIEEHNLVGLSALIYERDEEAYFGAFGMADRENSVPMARDTIVQIYSMTKPVTGVVLMSLYEQGLLDLQQRLDHYLPEYANLKVFSHLDEHQQGVYVPPTRPIKVIDILRHTAGFVGDDPHPQLSALWQQQDPMNANNTLAEMSKRIAKVPLLFQPGTRWHYGPSVDIQAHLAQTLAGKPYDQLLAERVLEPLGMSDTHYLLPQNKRHRFAAMYQREEDGSMRPKSKWNYLTNTRPQNLTPGGWGLVSTLDDYMTFARMLLNNGELNGNRILSPETIKLMRQDCLPSKLDDKSFLPEKGQMGFGIDFAVRVAPPVNQQEPSGAVGEFFWDGLANTLFWVDPVNQICAVLFNQFMPYGAVSTHKPFRDAVYAQSKDANCNANR